MRRATGFAVSWLLFGIGHIVSRPMLWWDWPVYPVYNWLMLASCGVQDWGGSGPWEVAND
ncbi:hypothetical protein AB4Y32_16275 [Paraburkholderia phymatum]|uniref:Uncharacterized protein n=1 Tax=Paraburkholderia phymatum TaxID=148447 RepID=A0ACC6U180_9BURK